MAGEIQFTRTAREQLRKLSRRNQGRILAALDLLRQNDATASLYLLEKESKGKRVKLLKEGRRMIWKVRIRHVRILCAVEGNALVVAAILRE